MKITRAERIYQWHLTHPTWSYAAIGGLFRCTREWVRVIVDRETTKRAVLISRASEIAEENLNLKDSLNDRG